MKKLFVLVSLLVLATLILSACGTPTTPAPTEPPVVVTDAPVVATEAPVALSGDPIRGGLLYDHWMKVLGMDTPEGDQPLWATQTTNTRSGKDTWRCKECHGWDYKGVEGAYGGGSHMTGFVGVYQVAGMDTSEVLGMLKGSTNADHDFSAVMDDQALTDLAFFISGNMLDSAAFITEKMPVGGNPENGKTVYEQNCASCHNADGTAFNFGDESAPAYVGTIALDNPWEFVHKVRFGQPATEMPALVKLGVADQEYIDLLAYAQSLPTVSPTVSLGGRLYDNWIKVTDTAGMSENQPLWATQTTNERSGNDTWRCKECHGWDYLGFEGRYASGSHSTGFPGIFAAKDKSADELTTALKGKNHDFSAYLDDAQMSAIVAFIQQLQDQSPYINADKTINGDAEHGKALYGATCEMCHGEDGTAIDFDDGEDKEFVGTLAADNPWEAFNKIAYGQPGADAMPAGVNLGWSWQDIADLLTYLQTLPIE